MILHQLEISQKHVTTRFGLSIISSLVTPWIHGSNPISFLLFNEHLERFKRELKNGKFFEKMIESLLLNNPHRLTLIMNPSSTYNQVLAQNEKQYLQSIQEKLTTQDIENIDKEAQILKQRQNEKVDNNCLPTLLVSVKKHIFLII